MTRPFKLAVGDRCIANEKAPSDYRLRRGTITELGAGGSMYGVRFDGADGVEYLYSWWLGVEWKGVGHDA